MSRSTTRTSRSRKTAPEAEAPAATVQASDEPTTVLRGRLCADPQLRHTATSGKPVVNLRIAVNDGDEATFHTVVAWGRTAEVVAKFLKKGRLVEIEGHPAVCTWTDQDGNERQSEEINAFRVTFLGRGVTAQHEVDSDRELS